MPRDPLDALIRLRRLSLDEAMRELGARLAEEAEAVAAIARIEALVAAEQDAAGRLDADDAAVEGFGRWLRRIGHARAALQPHRTAVAGSGDVVLRVGERSGQPLGSPAARRTGADLRWPGRTLRLGQRALGPPCGHPHRGHEHQHHHGPEERRAAAPPLACLAPDHGRQGG